MRKSLISVAVWGLPLLCSCTMWPSGTAVRPGEDAGAMGDALSASRAAPRAADASMPEVDAGTAAPDGPTAPLDPDAAAVPAGSADAAPTAMDGAPPDDIAPPVSSPDAATSPDAASTPPDAPPAPPPPLRILHAHDVTTMRLTAGVVYAHLLAAKSGTVVTSAPPLSAVELTDQLGTQDLKPAELVVDVLYAHDIHAGVVQVQEAHVSSIKIDMVTP